MDHGNFNRYRAGSCESYDSVSRSRYPQWSVQQRKSIALALTTARQSSEAPAVEETTKNSAAENVKAFVAGGFGGASAVLVGENSFEDAFADTHLPHKVILLT